MRASGEQPDAVFNVQLYTSTRAEREFARLGIAMRHRNLELFRQRDQRRFKFDPQRDVDFYVRDHRRDAVLFPPVLYERRLYGQELVQVATPDLSRVDEATAGAYRTLYRQVAATAPALSGDVDVYRDETAISWVKEPCPPGGVNGARDMIVVPLAAAEPRYAQRARGVRVDDTCLWQAPLPEQPFAKIVFPNIGALASAAHLEERRRQHATLTTRPPAARSTFDVYREDGTLFYLKTPCVLADTEAPFFLHVRPVHLGDLPRHRRQYGFDALDFRFGGFDPHWHEAIGDIFDGVCLATLDLPDYSIASIATGQYDGDATLWRVDVGGG